EFRDKVEILQLPAPVLRDLKKLAAEVVKEESGKTPMARKVHASFTKFQALVGPWDHVAEGAYHQLVSGWGVRRDDRATPVARVDRWGAGRYRDRCRRRRPERHRAAEGPVADVHDLAPGAGRAPGRGPAAGEDRRGDERRAVPDRGLPGRSDHVAVRVLRR